MNPGWEGVAGAGASWSWIGALGVSIPALFAQAPAPTPTGNPLGDGGLTEAVSRSAVTLALFAAASLAPAALLMTTAYVRVVIVLSLLRQALGSPQIPGNQVVQILALLITAMIMKPTAEEVRRVAIQPYGEGRLSLEDAWDAGVRPVKRFMARQIDATGHARYATELLELSRAPAPAPARPGEPIAPAAPEPEPEYAYLDELPLHVLGAAFLLAELNTALWIGFAVYLPFLVIDLVTASALSAMGLYLLPPAQVAIPLKLIVFALAEGWWLVTDMLIRGFSIA